ncbi:hypothetical protein PTKIN_Ptkin16aG0060300 [Pterospermum kingtungense]
MGKRLAVVVGCNYPMGPSPLRGCINDAVAIRKLLLERFHFDASNVRILIDGLVPVSAGFTTVRPTGANIKAAIDWMVEQAKPGDVLFFHFSGHGTIDGGHQVIVPSDGNLIKDVDLRQFIRRLPERVSFTIISDSCHSGGLIDKKKEQIGPATIRRSVNHVGRRMSDEDIYELLKIEERIRYGTVQGGVRSSRSDIKSHIGSLLVQLFGDEASLEFQPGQRDVIKRSITEDEGILLSGCQENETSADVPASPRTGGLAHGAFTFAVLKTLRESHYQLNNYDLVMKVRKALLSEQPDQHPCLYSSDGNAKATFLVV